jgi:hypothetical protein
MTEEEWLTGTDSEPLLQFLRRQGHDRKARLFACGCCQKIWNHITDPVLRNAVDVTERFADRAATTSQLRMARRKVDQVVSNLRASWASSRRTSSPEQHSNFITYEAAIVVSLTTQLNITLEAVASYTSNILTHTAGDPAGLVRDIFGNPFRPVTFDPEWRTTTAVALARGIYDERAFDRLPILGDALQDAGCDNDDLLNHLRHPNATHVRGCWALDLVLGKE